MCLSMHFTIIILTNLCVPRARSPRGAQSKAWKLHGSPMERAKGFPTGKTGTEAQVFLKEPTATVFLSERRDGKAIYGG